MPQEDQGVVMINMQLPPGATNERSFDVIKQVEAHVLKQPEVESMIAIQGYSFSGQGTNVGLAFTTLKDWKERTAPGSDAVSLAGRWTGELSRIREAFVLAVTPPAIQEPGQRQRLCFPPDRPQAATATPSCWQRVGNCWQRQPKAKC